MVTPGSQIFVGATQTAPGDSGEIAIQPNNPYAGGVAIDLRDGVTAINGAFNQDTYFIATFRVAPAAVPTLSGWTMIIFSLMLAGGAVLYIQRRWQTG